jgi:hypothetical protein
VTRNTSRSLIERRAVRRIPAYVRSSLRNQPPVNDRGGHKFRCPAVGVAGDALSGFKSAVVFQKIVIPGRPE